MKIENKENMTVARDEEESILLPEGYEGEKLFPETGEMAAEKAEAPEENKINPDITEKTQTENAPQEKKNELQGRDFLEEVAALLAQQPQLRDQLARGESLPQEVISECVKNGVPLRTAYAEFDAKQARAEAEQMRRENEILKQNSAAAAKAPVRGTAAGGGTETKGKDPFLEGLLSDE